MRGLPLSWSALPADESVMTKKMLCICMFIKSAAPTHARLAGIVRAAIVTSAVFAMGGCAFVPVADQRSAPPNGPAPTAVFVERFELTARISVRVSEKVDTAKITWVRLPPNETLRISTPFGSQIAEVIADKNGASVSRAGHGDVSASAASVADLMAAVIGVRLDTAALARWVQGFDLQTTVELVSFPEAGVNQTWNVRAENFRIIDGVRVATRLDAIAGDIVVRVVIDEFRAR